MLRVRHALSGNLLLEIASEDPSSVAILVFGGNMTNPRHPWELEWLAFQAVCYILNPKKMKVWFRFLFPFQNVFFFQVEASWVFRGCQPARFGIDSQQISRKQIHLDPWYFFLCFGLCIQKIVLGPAGHQLW